MTFVGFLRGELLISVRLGRLLVATYTHYSILHQGFLAVHISPGTAKGEVQSMRGGNASLHDITSVTLESIAYIAVLVRLRQPVSRMATTHLAHRS